MIEIQVVRPSQAAAVQCLILEVCQEVFQVSEAVLLQHDRLEDLAAIERYYAEPNGIFLVAIDESEIIGSGAIRRFDAEGCELKRLFFRPAYRGQGLGKRMANQLLNFAVNAGYQQVRLDVVDRQKQAAAIQLYQRLGFEFIDR